MNDPLLRKTILSCIADDERIAIKKLRVGVSNGIVHLAGIAASIEERELAAEIAAAIPAVRGVVNRIEAPEAPQPARVIDLNFDEKLPHLERPNHVGTERRIEYGN